ncbi:MAG: GH25 family lysozyme [Ruminococcus sp.]
MEPCESCRHRLCGDSGRIRQELSQKDVQFEANYAGCTSAGIPAGAYWYSMRSRRKRLGRRLPSACGCCGKSFAFPVYFDLEERRALALGRAACTAIAQAFLETVEQAGYFVGIYSSKSHLENCLTEELRKRYAVWVAHYGVKQTDYAGQHGMCGIPAPAAWTALAEMWI